MNHVNTKCIPKLFDEKETPNWYDSTPMNDETARTIRLPRKLWAALDRDAIDCKRSSVKQLEAVLSAYYLNDASSLNFKRINELSPTGGIRDSSDVIVAVQSEGTIGRRSQAKRKAK